MLRFLLRGLELARKRRGLRDVDDAELDVHLTHYRRACVPIYLLAIICTYERWVILRFRCIPGNKRVHRS